MISSSSPLATHHYVEIETYQAAMRRIEKLEKVAQAGYRLLDIAPTMEKKDLRDALASLEAED